MKNLKIHLFVLLFFTFLTVIFTYPLIWHLDRAVFDIFEPLILSWRMAWNAHQLFKDPLNLFQANIFYPSRNSLAYSENLIGITILVLPIIKIFNNPILAHNLALFLSFILSGYGMFLLTFYLTKNFLASLLSGLIYTFAPFKIFRMLYHINILSGQWLPFAFLYLYKFFEDKKIKNIILFSFFSILQTLTSFHYFLFLLIGLIILIIIEIFFQKKLFFEKKFLKGLYLASLIILAIILPILWPYFQLEKLYKSNQKNIIYEMAFYTPSLKDFFIPWYIKKDYKDIEKNVFPGIITLIFLAVSFFIFSKNKLEEKQKRILITFSLIALIGLLLSFGPLLKIKEHYFFNFGPYLPFSFLPGFKSIRAVGRFIILFIFGISLIIGLAISIFLKKKSLTKLSFLFLLMILFIIESLLISIKFVYLIELPIKKDIPYIYQTLAKEKDDFPLLELPILINGKPEISAIYMYFSTYHWKKLVNGSSSYYPPLYPQFVKTFIDFPHEKSIRLIKALGVKYIIIHYNLMKKEEKERIKREIIKFPELVLKENFKDNNLEVYEVIEK
ncbi:MAG: hypothetical protein ACK413_01915 [Patescibacteria group bacterium]